MRFAFFSSLNPTSSSDWPLVSSTAIITNTAPIIDPTEKIIRHPCKSKTSKRMGKSLTHINVTMLIEKQIIAIPQVRT